MSTYEALRTAIVLTHDIDITKFEEEKQTGCRSLLNNLCYLLDQMVAENAAYAKLNLSKLVRVLFESYYASYSSKSLDLAHVYLQTEMQEMLLDKTQKIMMHKELLSTVANKSANSKEKLFISNTAQMQAKTLTDTAVLPDNSNKDPYVNIAHKKPF